MIQMFDLWLKYTLQASWFTNGETLLNFILMRNNVFYFIWLSFLCLTQCSVKYKQQFNDNITLFHCSYIKQQTSTQMWFLLTKSYLNWVYGLNRACLGRGNRKIFGQTYTRMHQGHLLSKQVNKQSQTTKNKWRTYHWIGQYVVADRLCNVYMSVNAVWWQSHFLFTSLQKAADITLSRDS